MTGTQVRLSIAIALWLLLGALGFLLEQYDVLFM